MANAFSDSYTAMIDQLRDIEEALRGVQEVWDDLVDEQVPHLAALDMDGDPSPFDAKLAEMGTWTNGVELRPADLAASARSRFASEALGIRAASIEVMRKRARSMAERLARTAREQARGVSLVTRAHADAVKDPHDLAWVAKLLLGLHALDQTGVPKGVEPTAAALIDDGMKLCVTRGATLARVVRTLLRQYPDHVQSHEVLKAARYAAGLQDGS